MSFRGGGRGRGGFASGANRGGKINFLLVVKTSELVC